MALVGRIPNRTDMVYEAIVSALKAYFGLSETIPDVYKWNGNYKTGRPYINRELITAEPDQSDYVDEDLDIGKSEDEPYSNIHIQESFPTLNDMMHGKALFPCITVTIGEITDVAAAPDRSMRSNGLDDIDGAIGTYSKKGGLIETNIAIEVSSLGYKQMTRDIMGLVMTGLALDERDDPWSLKSLLERMGIHPDTRILKESQLDIDELADSMFVYSKTLILPVRFQWSIQTILFFYTFTLEHDSIEYKIYPKSTDYVIIFTYDRVARKWKQIESDNPLHDILSTKFFAAIEDEGIERDVFETVRFKRNY